MKKQFVILVAALSGAAAFGVVDPRYGVINSSFCGTPNGNKVYQVCLAKGASSNQWIELTMQDGRKVYTFVKWNLTPHTATQDHWYGFAADVQRDGTRELEVQLDVTRSRTGTIATLKL